MLCTLSILWGVGYVATDIRRLGMGAVLARTLPIPVRPIPRVPIPPKQEAARGNGPGCPENHRWVAHDTLRFDKMARTPLTGGRITQPPTPASSSPQQRRSGAGVRCTGSSLRPSRALTVD